MSPSLRRSRRATKKGISVFHQDDIVEIDRGQKIIAYGRLAQLLTEGASPLPRWLIKFDGQPYKDEEMYERDFGKLMNSKTLETVLSDHTKTNHDDATGTNKSHTGSFKSNTNHNSRILSAEEKSGEEIATETVKPTMSFSRKKKPVPNPKQVTPLDLHHVSASGGDGSDDSSRQKDENSEVLKADRVSAREQRSLRRQAKIDVKVFPKRSGGILDVLAPGGKRKNAFSSSSPHRPSKKAKIHNNGHAMEGEQIIKIPMRTGTLYSYRSGTYRRVQFVPLI